MSKFGVLIFPTSYCMPIDALARAVEERGFESLFVCEHTHIPASRKTPWPGGTDLPKQYYHTLDPYVALCAAAMVTKDLKLGTGVTLLTQHDPLVLAKTIASLDQISAGRVVLGVGAGWNVEEMTNHGTPYPQRWAVLRERALAMRALWSQDKASFEGKYVNFEEVFSYPKPRQPGGPKMLLGASSKWTYDRVAQYADGWMPIYQDRARAAQQVQGALDYAAGIAKVEQCWQKRGRAGSPEFSIFGVPGKQAVLESMQELGFHRQLLGLPSADADTLLPMLDKFAALAHRCLANADLSADLNKS